VDFKTEENEKRKSVRITARLLLGHWKITAEKFNAIKTDCDNGISMYNRKELADIQVYVGAQAALSKLQSKDKDLAAFLQHLDGKLNLLLKKIDPAPSLFDKLLLQRINIGGDGLAYWTDEIHQQGELVELHIIMPSDNSYINCFCEVVNAWKEKDEGGKEIFRVSLKYVLIMEHDREMLIQYNFKQQSFALQRRRLDQEG
jgi:hypothetical protein